MSSTQPPGRTHPEIKVIRSARRRKSVQARMVAGVLEVRIPAWMSAREENEAVQDMLARLEKKTGGAAKTDAALLQRAEQLNAQYLDGRAWIGSIRWVSNQNTRWGSCTTSTADIRLSNRLQQVPDYVLDSVIIHELTHTFIPRHGREFWQWADRAPHAERAKGYLEAYQRWGG
ncbi:M48 family metallopeptidase [Corynebacterium accolens]|uniref:M48 family metallopeptidase n=1 Tax=Corynebacterium accolens TaxID=38284 RepID=UPI00031E38DC|nr:SprT-like domain-containing protein [Corynebacterium accolens]